MCGLVSAHAKYLSVFCILCKLGSKVDINSASTEFCLVFCGNSASGLIYTWA